MPTPPPHKYQSVEKKCILIYYMQLLDYFSIGIYYHYLKKTILEGSHWIKPNFIVFHFGKEVNWN